jgi:hypothetical protein
MCLAEVRRYFGRIMGVQAVHGRWVASACDKGLPWHRDPVTGKRYWLESEIDRWVEDVNQRTLNSRLDRRWRRRAS